MFAKVGLRDFFFQIMNVEIYFKWPVNKEVILQN